MAANWEIGFWVVLGLLILLFVVAIVFLILAAVQVPVSQDSLVRLENVSVTHNGATQMTVLLSVSYSGEPRADRVVTYSKSVTTVNAVMNSGSFQEGAPWELVAKELGQQFWNDYDLNGVSIQLLLTETGLNMAGPSWTYGTVSKVNKFDAQS